MYYCGREGLSEFDIRTEARLEREKRLTKRGLRILRNYKRIRRYRRDTLNQNQGKKLETSSWEKNGIENLAEEEFQNKETKKYPLTKLSILRRNIQIKREKAWKRYVNNFRKKKLISSLNSLKLQTTKRKRDSLCQFSQRKEIDSQKEEFISEKEFFQDKEKIKKLDGEDLTDQNTDDSRWLNLMKILEESSEETIIEDPLIIEAKQNEVLNKNNSEGGKKERKIVDKASSVTLEGEDNFDFLVEDLASRRMRDSEKVKKKKNLDKMPRDTCFYSQPSDVIFKDFEAGKTYNRKVSICNKSSKWAYLRYDQIEWKTEAKNLEVEIEKTKILRPGLQVPLTVKFSSEKEEDIRADLIFLTLSPENPEDFHIFRISVLCIPTKPLPSIEPTEVRFVTTPIWKFGEFGHLKNTLTIFNQGIKPFSFRINEPRGNNFFWDLWDSESQNSECEISQIQSDDNLQEKVPDAFSSQKTGSSIELGYRMIEMNNKNEETGKFRVALKEKSKFQLKIKFNPKYVGIHSDSLIIDFEVGGKFFKREIVNIFGEVNGLNLSLNPMIIDLGTIVTDSEVYQQNFKINNTGKTSMAVIIKIPKVLRNQIEVFPKSTIVQSKGSSLINIRLIPKEDIINDRLGYFDQTSNILTIPIQIKPSSPEAVNAPPLILKVLATVTTSHALILKPEILFLGRVHIQESVVSQIFLTNQSLIIQDFGFLNLPPYLEIQPNYGFGKILPGETIELDLIYSPSVNDFPKKNENFNENHIIQIQVTTMAELVGNKIMMERAKAGKQFQIIKEDFPEGKLEILKNFEGSGDNNFDTKIFSPEISNREEEIEGSRNKKNEMKIYVQVVDLFCELSEQIIEFPATPCASFCVASIQLRGFQCPANKNKGKKFTATFEFKTSSQFIKTAPQKGFLESGDFIKVTFLFAPKLSNHLALKKIPSSKAEILEKEFKKSKEKIVKSVERDEKIQKVKKNSSGKKSQKDEKKEKSEKSSEKILEEVSILENFEPYVFTAIVTCNIKIEEENGSLHKEILFAKLYCPVVKPDFLILNNSREFEFGATAVGTTARKILCLKNTSNRKLKINATLLNPFGPFFMPSGQFLEPGSVLSLPITFAPKEEEEQVQEFFEIRAAETRTMWRMALSGKSVVPNWTIEPKIFVARLEAKPGKTEELTIKIKNTGECPLTFRLKILEILEGPIFSSSISQNNEDAIKKGKGTKGGHKKEKFSLRLTEEEAEAIYGGKLGLVQNQNVFSFVNFDEKMCILVQPKENVDFTIRFHPRKAENEIETKKERKKDKILSGKQSKNEIETNIDSVYQIGRFNLRLGNLIDVQDFTLICRAK